MEEGTRQRIAATRAGDQRDDYVDFYGRPPGDV